MEEQSIYEHIREILAGRLAIAPDEVKLDSRLNEDLDLDSLDMVELSMRVEEDYGIEILDEQIGDIKIVGDVVALITESIKAKD